MINKKSDYEWNQWWESIDANIRFELMKKYKIKKVNDKLIKRMWYYESS